MGPVRGRLKAAAILLLPTPAHAEVCDKVRPDWSAAAGPQGVLAETAYILTSPPALALIALLVLALVLPRLWLAIPAALLTLGFAALLILSRRADMAAQALAEGCLASATPAALILLLAAILTFARALSLRSRR